MVDINEVAENIYMIDDQLYSIPQCGSVYLINEEKKALIDAGPTTSADTVLDGVRKVGVRPEDIDYLIVTHIHLDHAGGAGVLIKDMPKARVVVHHKGARHLINPSKLISSVLAAQGEEAMVRTGGVVPIEEQQVQPVYDGDEIELGDKQVLKFIDAPGHAPHELCIYESRNNGLFTGDAAGLYVANEILLPSTPPPNFDEELYVDTLQRLMKLDASMIYFAHFGVGNEVQKILKLALYKLQIWRDMVTRAIEEDNLDGVAERIIAQACAELEPIREMAVYEHLTQRSIPGNVAGYIKCYQERHEAKRRGNSEGN